MSAYKATWCLVGLSVALTLLHAPIAAVFVLVAATGVALSAADDEHRDARRRNRR